MNRNRVIACACVVAALALRAPSARGAGSTADSLCIHFAGSSPGILVELEAGVVTRGMPPFMLCTLPRGSSFRMTVDGEGLERRTGMLSIGERGLVSIGGTRIRQFVRDAVLPGWGSAYVGERARGLMHATSLAAVLTVLSQEQIEYRHIRNRFDILEERLADAATVADAKRIRAVAREASIAVNTQNDHRSRLLYLSAALYAHQLVDPWLAGRTPRASVEGNTVTVGGVSSSRFKAFVLSAIRPGRGQFYQGKPRRGILFSVLSTAAGLAALEYQNQYDEAADGYTIAVDRFEAATSLADRDRLREAAELRWNDVRSAEDRRTAAFIALAGAWGLNLIDTFFEPGKSGSSESYSLDLGVEGVSLGFRF